MGIALATITVPKALSRARRLGCDVEMARATGEVVISHRESRRRVRMNVRRHDASQELRLLLRDLEREHNDEQGRHDMSNPAAIKRRQEAVLRALEREAKILEVGKPVSITDVELAERTGVDLAAIRNLKNDLLAIGGLDVTRGTETREINGRRVAVPRQTLTLLAGPLELKRQLEEKYAADAEITAQKMKELGKQKAVEQTGKPHPRRAGIEVRQATPEEIATFGRRMPEAEVAWPVTNVGPDQQGQAHEPAQEHAQAVAAAVEPVRERESVTDRLVAYTAPSETAVIEQPMSVADVVHAIDAEYRAYPTLKALADRQHRYAGMLHDAEQLRDEDVQLILLQKMELSPLEREALTLWEHATEAGRNGNSNGNGSH